VTEVGEEHIGTLSTLPAGRSDYRLVLVVVGISTLIFLAAAPFAKVQLAVVEPFLPAYQTALVVTDLLTAVLLFGLFAIVRSRSLLILASGYVFCAFMAIAHTLSFPGLFAAGGAIGGGPQTTAWIYFLWHGAFPLLVVAYALVDGDEPGGHRPVGHPLVAIPLGVAAAFVLALALTLLTTVGHDALPRIMRGNLDDSTKVYVASATWVLSIVALLALWRRRNRTVLDLWLMVVMTVWIFDVALAAVLNHGRFDIGWYGGRVYGLLATSFVLIVLLIEHGVLRARFIAAPAAESRQFRRAEENAAELLAANRDLKAFSYSVSHDLRGPLRTIDGFSRMLEEDHAGRLDDAGRDCTARIRLAARRMASLIDDLLNLSLVSQADLRRVGIDLSALAREIADTLRERAPDRDAVFVIAEAVEAQGDPGLVRIALDNLLGNAWKFTSGRSPAEIEFGQSLVGGRKTYYVRDNGAGFEMAQAEKLFQPFHRLHDEREFPGTGIGLAIVHRIVAKHGGRIWAESDPEKGTAFYFNLTNAAADVGAAVGNFKRPA
jgi:signal transduction histidine kinase